MLGGRKRWQRWLAMIGDGNGENSGSRPPFVGRSDRNYGQGEIVLVWYVSLIFVVKL